MDITGKQALVTGAGQGIGEASAMMLAENGIGKIVISDINEANLEKVAAGIADLGAEPIIKVADVTDMDAVMGLFAEAEAATGGLDIVHNNAGIMTGGPDFPDSGMDGMIRVIQINLLAMMVGSKCAIDSLRKRGAPGVIINTASVAAFNPMPADPAYATSKVGILRFTESCKPLHEAFNIRVMAVCPGVVDTAIVPHDKEWLKPTLEAIRFLQPADIAAAVKNIIEDDSLSGDQVTVQNEPL